MQPDQPTRRRFLGACAAAALPGPGAVTDLAEDEATIRRQVESHRPGALPVLPEGLVGRLGSTHVAGRYHLGNRPFLEEGADRLIALGTRLGKFWFQPHRAGRDYPWNHQWPRLDGNDLVGLARTAEFRATFARPFQTIALEALRPVDEVWRSDAAAERLEEVERGMRELAAYLYATYGDRQVTFLLQNWEGDWRLRGGFSQEFRPGAEERERLCARMSRWIDARQKGVRHAREQAGRGARCRVGHVVEVNRVLDAALGMPTVAADVLPRVEVDLVSYSSYDALGDPVTLWRAVRTIQQHARTGPLFGERAVMLGEIGVPEIDQPDGIAAKWDAWLGVALALDLPYVIQWQLYCNEARRGVPVAEPPPVRRAEDCRGFWLVKPDGALGETGRYLAGLWQRAGRGE
jgi:hypothetical protein